MFEHPIRKAKWLGTWLLDHILGTYAALAILGIGVSFAATYDAYNVPDMKLWDGINTTQESDIKITWPYRNNVQYAFPGSGGVLELRQSGKVEHIYFSDVINDSDNKIFTLTGTVIRDLAWNNCDEYVSNSDGRSFQRSADARMVDDCRLFNFSLKKDKANICTASGCVQFSGSGSLRQPTFATTDDRDRNLGSAPETGRSACTLDTGLCYDALGGTWVARGSSATPNATEAIAGKVQLANTGAIVGATATGSTSAANALYAKFTSLIGGIGKYGFIPVIGRTGTLTGSLLGSGSNTASTFLRGDGVWAASVDTQGIYPGFYGDASDGDVTLSTNTTLTRDMFYDHLSLNGFTLDADGYRVYARTISGSGAISNNGGNASGQTGGAAAGLGYLGTGKAGVNGGNGGAGGANNGAAGSAGNSVTNAFGTGGLAGVSGGNGCSGGGNGGAGGIGGTKTAAPANKGHFRAITNLLSWRLSAPTQTGSIAFQYHAGNGGSGGGGGGCSGAGAGTGGAGGGSGADGGGVWIAAQTISGTFNIQANGGNGGNGVNGSSGSGGGGAGNGGNGGVAALFYGDKSGWSGTITASGGTAGIFGAGGSGGGQPGNSAYNGTDGVTIQLQF